MKIQHDEEWLNDSTEQIKDLVILYHEHMERKRLSSKPERAVDLGWYKVSDGLPDNDQVVDIVENGTRYTDVTYDKGAKVFWCKECNHSGMGIGLNRVTHWMPIKDLPR